MQVANNSREAQTICRAEFQKCAEYFISRLVQKAIGERYMRPESSTELLPHGETFCQAVDGWRAKLQGAIECLLPAGARNSAKHWRAYKNVPVSAYEPTTGEGQWPFFVSLDRGPAHSFWLVHDKVHLVKPGIPLLQLLKVPPRGHDIHQIVEHAIGVMKAWVYKCLGRARAEGVPITTALLSKIILEGCARFTAASWDSNLPRLWNCLRIIAAPKGQPVQVTVTSKSGKQRTSMQLGTGGGYCPPRVS